MFARAENNSDRLIIASLPSICKSQVMRYLQGLRCETVRGEWGKCAACGTSCTYTLGGLPVCVICQSQCESQPLPPCPRPVICSVSELKLNARYAFGVLLSAGFSLASGSIMVGGCCDICLWRSMCKCISFTSERRVIIVDLYVCDDCHIAATKHEHQITTRRRSLLCLSGMIGMLPEIAQLVREYTYRLILAVGY